MNTRNKRISDIFENVIPPKGSKEYKAMQEFFSKNRNSPEEKKIMDDFFKKSINSLIGQYESNCGFITEMTLRHFLKEFNYRAWKHGLRSMPMMFNIMESFFIYRKPEIYFELIEEENYLISFFDFMNFISKENIRFDISKIKETLATDIIYNFNIGADLNEVIFKIEGEIDFIITGISMVRREDEVTVLIIAGSDKITEITEMGLTYSNNLDKEELLKEFDEVTKNKKQTPIFVDNQNKYSKVLFACKIDLESSTIDARYVAEEYTNMFRLKTDQMGFVFDELGEFITEKHEEYYNNSIGEIKKYEALFEAAKNSLFIPYFLTSNEDDIITEEHETNFKKLGSSIFSKGIFKNTFGYKSPAKTLYILNYKNKFEPDKIKLRDDLFKIETSGFWKTLNVDDIGQDKKGKPIHGKTWVNKNLSWFEGKHEELTIKKKVNVYDGPNSGSIYILRNPTFPENVIKIGLTRNNVNERLKQLSNTSVPDKFYCIQEWHVYDCVKAESEIHDKLKDYRVDPRREFFNIEYDLAKETISTICNLINENK